MLEANKVVIDTNVFVSGLLSSPVSRSVIEAWLDGRFVLVLSSQLLGELLDVLSRPKISRYINVDQQQILMSSLLNHAEFVVPAQHITLCRDPKDDIFLDVAIAAQAHYLVTNDNDFLEDDLLRNSMLRLGVLIITPVDFVTTLP
jgi:putative PIN family toxin of toxin-antitoxin system